ncbi:MAG TPA: HdeD family acid-resistance protein [Myxococcota bacterium]|nr:HdeD family acid-resistance protein [Myxococcota bacterium]
MTPLDARLASILARGWWLLLLRGLAAVAFGVFALAEPGASLAVLVLLFGSYALVDGVLCTWTAVSGRAHHESWWVLLIEGLLGIGVGVLTFVEPGITALVILFYIAVWAIATGVLEIVAAVRLRKEIQGEWLLALAGVVSISFGVMLMARPGAGALALLWLIASYAIFFGTVLVVLAFRARRFAHAAAPR